MIAGMHIKEEFEVEDVDELIKVLRDKNLLNLTLEKVKEKVKKFWKDSDWEDLVCNCEVIDYILRDLATGFFSWKFEDNDIFTISIIDSKNPFFKEGKE